MDNLEGEKAQISGIGDQTEMSALVEDFGQTLFDRAGPLAP